MNFGISVVFPMSFEEMVLLDFLTGSASALLYTSLRQFLANSSGDESVFLSIPYPFLPGNLAQSLLLHPLLGFS